MDHLCDVSSTDSPTENVGLGFWMIPMVVVVVLGRTTFLDGGPREVGKREVSVFQTGGGCEPVESHLLSPKGIVNFDSGRSEEY